MAQGLGETLLMYTHMHLDKFQLHPASRVRASGVPVYGQNQLAVLMRQFWSDCTSRSLPAACLHPAFTTSVRTWRRALRPTLNECECTTVSWACAA